MTNHGGTLYVANSGIDPAGCTDCGTKTSPCRSISCAIGNAVAGDKIIVGPDTYGDLDGDSTLGATGEETAAPGCGCMLAVNKAVSVTLSDGAANHGFPPWSWRRRNAGKPMIPYYR